MEIISFIAHGYPGPDLERCAVLGQYHLILFSFLLAPFLGASPTT
jgi:hypothetical protein